MFFGRFSYKILKFTTLSIKKWEEILKINPKMETFSLFFFVSQVWRTLFLLNFCRNGKKK